MKTTKRVEINNRPTYADEYPFEVARKLDGEYWFWGAYDDEAKAVKAANEIKGRVFYNE